MNMKQINHGFKDFYFLTDEGQVYNSKTKKFLKGYHEIFKLATNENGFKNISLSQLYQIVFSKNFCYNKFIQEKIRENSKEVFKPIKGTGGFYLVSNLGNIISLKGCEPKALKTQVNSKGYERVKITINNVSKYVFVHILVAENFIGDIPKNYQVHHKDFNKNNNRLSNLEVLSVWDHLKKHREKHQEN